jgi:eukaryotic-like serine/threonine-protein kinase
MSDLRSQLQQTLGSAYTLERELGGGGMSRVFLAEEAALGRKVVVKVLPPELTAGVNVDRFRREIQLSAKLQHPHIVPVLSTGETGGVPYYTMPFVEGESLRARLAKTGPLPITDAVNILRDTARALAYAHERGVVHRDIKPDNILLTSGTASVADFGIAKAVAAARTDAPNSTLTQVGTSIGTPAYMAPEQAAGDPGTDHRADLYAFGCMAYETLAGRPPFIVTVPHKLMAAHMTEIPDAVSALRPDTPASLAALVMRCLEKDPANRPASAIEVVGALDNVTSAGGHDAMPSILLGGPGMFKRALSLYALAFVVVAIVARAAIVATGLPDWVFSGALIVMALGLPVILFTAYVQRTTRRYVTITPSLTPGGSPSVPVQGTMQTLAMKASPHMSWRRTLLGGVYALVAFIVLVGGYMLLRTMGIGSAGSLMAAGKMSSREPLLVTDFTVRNADSTLGRVLSDGAKTQLGQSNVITLMSPEGVADALRRMQRPANTALTLDLARELATRNQVRVIVDGDVTGVGTGYIVTMKLVTTDSAKVLASFQQAAASGPDLIEAVDALSRKIRGKVGESLKSVREAPQLARATTSSLEALRKYTEGVRAEQQSGNRDDAIARLEEAVKIDTMFAEAWRKLGIVKANAGRPRAQVESALVQAYKHRDRVPDGARDMIVASYYNSGPHRDRGLAVQAYESVLRRGDSLSGALNNLALLLGQRREFARAESLYLAQIRLDPRMFRTAYQNLAVAQRRLGKFDAADSTLAHGAALFPDLKAGNERSAVDALYRRGDTAAYRRAVDSMFTKGDSATKAFARSRVMNQALMDGKLSRYRTMLNEQRAVSAPNPTPRQKLNFALNGTELTIAAEWLGQPGPRVRLLDDAVGAFKGPLAPIDFIRVAQTYARLDQPVKARAWMARFDAEVKDTAARRELRPDIEIMNGDILYSEKKPLQAVEYYRRGDRLPDGPVGSCVTCLAQGLGYTYYTAGVADSAIKYFEYFVTTYDYERFFFDYVALAPVLNRLGQLYEQKGDREKAAKYYRDFANLWKNADPELQPQVAEARRKIARLADNERP